MNGKIRLLVSFFGLDFLSWNIAVKHGLDVFEQLFKLEDSEHFTLDSVFFVGVGLVEVEDAVDISAILGLVGSQSVVFEVVDFGSVVGFDGKLCVGKDDFGSIHDEISDRKDHQENHCANPYGLLEPSL